MRKNTYISFLFTACLVLILSACRGETEYGEEYGKISFSYTIEGMDAQATTRVMVEPEDGETRIETIHLFFFEATDDATGALIDVIVPSEGSHNFNMEQSYVLSGNVNAASEYHVLAVANMADFINGQDPAAWAYSFLQSGVTEIEFRNTAFAEVSGVSVDNTYGTENMIRQAGLPMFGFVKKNAGLQSVQVTLQRIVSRFDVINNISAETYGTYTIASASIWNAYSKASVTDDVMMNFAAESGHRLTRFYGIERDSESQSPDIIGGLYALPNYSASPLQNDKVTTCVIVGLINPDGEVRYYRVNINQSANVQQLKRNNIYKTTIVGIAGEGYSTEAEAYEGTTNQLLYLSNEWNLDDNGMIVTDENSLLAVPVKTVKIGSSGGELSYSVTTYSTLTNPSPLAIKSQSWDPEDGNIYATIQNGQLIITAASMSGNETLRSGIITVTYAGLETTVNVKQSAEAGRFLNVTVDEEWANTLPPTANGSSEFVFVDASGPWTVTMYGSENFALKSPLGLYTNTLTSADLNTWRFRIYTQYENVSTTDSPKGFALITLDEDPENYVAVVTVYQAVTGSISASVDLSSGINFYGSTYLNDGTGLAGGATSYEFTVSASGTISSNTVRIFGQNANKFNATFDATTNKVTVSCVEVNSGTTDYTATLAIADNSNGYLYIPLTQAAVSVSAVADISSFDATGGTMTLTVISSDPYDSSWTVSGTIASTTTGKTLEHHFITYADATNVALEDGASTTSTSIKVNIPKVYYPNRDMTIGGSVSLTSTMGGNSIPVSFTQTALTARAINVWSSSSGYGQIYSDDYFTAYYSAWSSYTKNTTYSDSRNYAHLNNTAYGGSWDNANLFLSNNDGVLVITGDESTTTNSVPALNSSPLSSLATFEKGATTGYIAFFNKAALGTRIYELLVERGASTLDVDNFSDTSTNFYIDAVHTVANSFTSTTAVPLITTAANGGGNTIMFIDPSKGMVYLGEGQTFDTLTANTVQMAFMNNFIQYIKLSAMYGSHFMDLLVDGSALPAPWSSAWGNSAETWKMTE